MKKITFKDLQFSALALLLYGSIAFFANYAYGLQEALVAAAIQGSLSFTITTFFIQLILFLLSHFRKLIAACMATIIVSSITVIVHLINQTPGLLMTVLPPCLLGTIFAFYYVYSVQKEP